MSNVNNNGHNENMKWSSWKHDPENIEGHL